MVWDAPVPLPHSVGSHEPRSSVAGQFESGILKLVYEAYYRRVALSGDDLYGHHQRDLGHYY